MPASACAGPTRRSRSTRRAWPAFLAGLDGSWAGLSLTMPLKEEAARLLADVDPTARALRSVNTVLPAGAGWRGTNTDVYGMTRGAHAGRTGRHARLRARPRRRRHREECGRRPRLARRAPGDRGRAGGPRRPRRCAGLAREFGLAADVADLTPDADLLSRPVVVSTLPGAAAEPWAALARRGARRAPRRLVPPVADAAGSVVGQRIASPAAATCCSGRRSSRCG